MWRKAKFNDTTLSSGHGRKAKKQGDPTFPKGVLEEKELSHRQKQRARKRLLKKQKLNEKSKEITEKRVARRWRTM